MFVFKKKGKEISITSCSSNPARFDCGELAAYKINRKDKRDRSQGATTGLLVSGLVFLLLHNKTGLADFSCKGLDSGGSVVKNPPTNAEGIRDLSLIPASGRPPTAGDGNALQYSCLENSKDRGA